MSRWHTGSQPFGPQRGERFRLHQVKPLGNLHVHTVRPSEAAAMGTGTRQKGFDLETRSGKQAQAKELLSEIVEKQCDREADDVPLPVDVSEQHLKDSTISPQKLREIHHSIRNSWPGCRTKGYNNQSVHWTHQYAVQDRVPTPGSLDDTSAQCSIEDLQLSQLLPNRDVQIAFRQDCAVLISRVLVKYFGPFSIFKDVVINHLPHPFSDAVSKKSNINCLGLEFLNSNIAGEMAQLMMKNPRTLCADEEEYFWCNVDEFCVARTYFSLMGMH
ncbi:hypothetical protein OS493_038964 [Desmophyllum pertusum]|uniref:Uncharacterized protein n=1 Tax=Desmophyllum pertusum TaxID=174260 RepID=A0A9W9Z6D2_9CNID|nr:hypothetical protein OS493_038964 [Desmophyllum pertusum]